MRLLYTTIMLLLFALTAPAQEKRLVILHTSDTHSRIEPIDVHAADEYAGMGGVVRRATFVKQMRAEYPDELLLLDCGDISQGTPYYNMFQGELEVEMMNLMGYDAMTIGNHEFDFGMENMVRLFRLAHFPVVCANYDVTGTMLGGLVKPYVILERNGLKIGIFGLSPKMEGLVQADKCAGIAYLDPVETARTVADQLKNREQCDLVICLSHLGIRGVYADDDCDEKLVAETRDIDIILGGHSHTYLEKPAIYLNADGKDVPLSHVGKSGVYVGKIELTLQKK